MKKISGVIKFDPPKLKDDCDHKIMFVQMGAAIVTSVAPDSRIVHGWADIGEKCIKCGGHTGNYKRQEF